jgi:hypothetical protein
MLYLFASRLGRNALPADNGVLPNLASPPKRLFVSALFALLVAFPVATRAQVVRVPADQPDLQSAISAVSDGGVIEIATGIYAAPAGGFTLYDVPKRMTIRAATGAQVSLSGGGTHDILRFANSSMSAGRPVTFEGITFANGRTTTNFLGGAMTLVHAQAVFTNCTFQNNAGDAPATGGGAQWINLAEVSFEGCTWSANTSPNYGAGLSALESKVYIRGGRFIGNRVNVPGHIPNAPGGAIFVTQSTLHIATSSFEGNQAGYVGGAIYALGDWQSPEGVPSVDLQISNSSFTNNSAFRDPSVSFTSPTVGGAIHIEDQATLKLFNCRFTNNIAGQGGAISIFRAITEIDGCMFSANRAIGTGSAEGIGGTIIGLSSDGVDPSTAFGTINRRAVQLDIRDSLFRGTGGGVADGRQGGSIFVNGDENAAYGLNGVHQNGTVASNRAVVNLTRVAFADSAVANSGAILGTGGAVMAHFVTLSIDSSVFQNCVASDFGGALEAIGGASVAMTRTTIAGCKAGSLGGAITMFGGNLNITQSNFVQNQTTGSGGNGSVITTAPAPAAGSIPAENISGMISNCVFSNNSGGPTIFDGDRGAPPFNLLQYSGNTIFSGTGGVAYDGDYVEASTVAQLNQLVMQRSDGTTTIKAPAPANVAPTSAPTVGALLMIPPTILQSGAPGETLPISSYLAYSSNGGPVTVDGAPQGSSSGIVPTTANGVHTLTVGSQSVATVPPPGAALNISTRLPVGTGQNVLIGGFIVQGPSPKKVIVRAIGPSLPLAGALQDPFLELHDSTGAAIATNDDWRSTQTIDIHATSLAPTNNAESAIVATLEPGAYTAVVRGANNTTGIAVVEAYDLDAVRSSKLANIATRGSIQTGDDVMIGGFILGGGTGATRVLVRGIGPSLGAFGITNSLADPMLELHDSNGALIDANDDWRTNQALIQSTGLQPTNNAESALLLSNPPPGAYTVILRGKSNGTGVGVVEAYLL